MSGLRSDRPLNKVGLLLVAGFLFGAMLLVAAAWKAKTGGNILGQGRPSSQLVSTASHIEAADSVDVTAIIIEDATLTFVLSLPTEIDQDFYRQVLERWYEETIKLLSDYPQVKAVRLIFLAPFVQRSHTFYLVRFSTACAASTFQPGGFPDRLSECPLSIVGQHEPVLDALLVWANDD